MTRRQISASRIAALILFPAAFWAAVIVLTLT